MPTPIAELISVYQPLFAVTSSGREFEFDDISYCLDDLLTFGWLGLQEYYTARYWVDQYRHGLAMPGTTLFRSVYSGEYVSFVVWLDELYLMFQYALRWYDVSDQVEDFGSIFDDEETDPEDDLAEIAGMVIQVMPNNIGRFNIDPAAHHLYEFDPETIEAVINNIQEVIDLTEI